MSLMISGVKSWLRFVELSLENPWFVGNLNLLCEPFGSSLFSTEPGHVQFIVSRTVTLRVRSRAGRFPDLRRIVEVPQLHLQEQLVQLQMIEEDGHPHKLIELS